MTQHRDACSAAPLAYRLVHHGPIELVGIEARFTSADTNLIAKLWRQFLVRHVEITNAALQPPLACVHPHSDGSFDYLCAVQVFDHAPPPESMVARSLPECDYAVIRHAGPVTTIRETMRRIREPGSIEQARFQPPFILELFLDRFDCDTGEGGVDIWVALASE